MKLRVPLYIFLIIFIFPDSIAPVTNEISFRTVYRDDHVFETKGTVAVRGSIENLNTVLLNFPEYSNWLLDDLDRESKKAAEQKKLPAVLVDILTEDRQHPDTLIVVYDLNRFIKIKGLKAPFTIESRFTATGVLSRLTFNYAGNKTFLKAGSYSFFFNESDQGIIIDFVCEARLSGILDFFFNVPAYDRNIGFYIRTLTANLKKRLEP